MKRYLFLLLLLTAASVAWPQRNVVYVSHIRSLQVTAGSDWTQTLPVIALSGGDRIQIAFDDMSHDGKRYSYRLEHCDADWQVSRDLLTSDYIEGFAEDNTIDDYTESVGTNHLYTHYTLTLPNEQCRMTMGGNYRLTVYDDSQEDVLCACFMVLDNPALPVALSVTTNTDRGLNTQYQQVGARLLFRSPYPVTDFGRQVRTVFLQNGRWDNAVYSPQPQLLSGDAATYDHNRRLIFDGGNVYRKFEILDPSHASMGVDSITWDGTEYHAWVHPDEPRRQYVYDESPHGSFSSATPTMPTPTSPRNMSLYISASSRRASAERCFSTPHGPVTC